MWFGFDFNNTAAEWRIELLLTLTHVALSCLALFSVQVLHLWNFICKTKIKCVSKFGPLWFPIVAVSCLILYQREPDKDCWHFHCAECQGTVLIFPRVSLTSYATFLALGICWRKAEKCSQLSPNPDVFLSCSRQTWPHTKSTPTCIISTASPLVTSPFLTSISQRNIAHQMTKTVKSVGKKV